MLAPDRTVMRKGPHLASCHSNSRNYSLTPAQLPRIWLAVIIVSPLPRITSASQSEPDLQFKEEALAVSEIAARWGFAGRPRISVINIRFRDHCGY